MSAPRPATAPRWRAGFAAAAVLTLLVAGCVTAISPTPAPAETPVGELGTRITYLLSGADGSPAPSAAADATRATLEARARVVDPRATVTIGADGRLVLESSGPISPAARRALLATGAVQVTPLPVERFGTGIAPGAEALSPGDVIPAGLEPLLRASDIDPAGVSLLPASDGGPGVTLRLTPAGREALATWSADHVGDFLAIAVDGRAVSIPVLQTTIDDGSLVISTAGAGWPTEDDLPVLRGAYSPDVRLVEDSIERVPAP